VSREGFDPCREELYTTRGGPGIASILAATLQQEDHKIRIASRRSPTTSRFVTENELELDRMRKISRSGRRRSSVVAAAISATLLSQSRPKSNGSNSQPASPTALKSKYRSSNQSSLSKSLQLSLAESPANVAPTQSLSLPSGLTTSIDEGTSSSSQWSEQTQGALTPHLDWSEEPMPVFEKLFPG